MTLKEVELIWGLLCGRIIATISIYLIVIRMFYSLFYWALFQIVLRSIFWSRLKHKECSILGWFIIWYTLVFNQRMQFLQNFHWILGQMRFYHAHKEQKIMCLNQPKSSAISFEVERKTFHNYWLGLVSVQLQNKKQLLSQLDSQPLQRLIALDLSPSIRNHARPCLLLCFKMFYIRRFSDNTVTMALFFFKRWLILQSNVEMLLFVAMISSADLKHFVVRWLVTECEVTLDYWHRDGVFIWYGK